MEVEKTNEEKLEIIRFEQELEFVQCLANPRYVLYLAHHHFDDENFFAYLKYLTYWKQPEYARFILFPSALQMLDLLLSNPTQARKILKDQNVCEELLFQQRLAWQDPVLDEDESSPNSSNQ